MSRVKCRRIPENRNDCKTLFSDSDKLHVDLISYICQPDVHCANDTPSFAHTYLNIFWQTKKGTSILFCEVGSKTRSKIFRRTQNTAMQAYEYSVYHSFPSPTGDQTVVSESSTSTMTCTEVRERARKRTGGHSE